MELSNYHDDMLFACPKQGDNFAINNALAYAITNSKGCVGAGHSSHRAEAFVYDKIWCSLE